MRRLCLALLVVTSAGPAARADWPVTQAPCTGVTASVTLWKQIGTNTLENLGFDGLGNVWISNTAAGRLQRFDSSGSAGPQIPVVAPGAINLGPDGLLYANFGDALAGALLRTGAAGVVRFDPATPPAAPPAPFVSGLNMANGGTFDAYGNLWVSNDVDAELTRIAPGGTKETFDDVWGTNGLVATGGSLYAAITFDQRSPIERISLADPAQHETFAELSFGAASLQPAVHAPEADPATTPLVGLKGLDDMTLGPDGRLYVVANGMGELLRVDVGTGEACLLASGLQNPSSVRFADPSFGDHAGDLFITEFSGAIRRVELTA